MTYNIGKEIRLRMLYDKSGLIFTVPMDHGYSIGAVGGLIDLNKTTKAVFAGGANSVVVHKGMVNSIKNSIPANGSLILHLSGSTTRSSRPHFKTLTCTVDSAISYGADAISCHINVGCTGDEEMLSSLSKLVDDCERTGFPLLAMMYARDDNGEDDIYAGALNHIARIAQESGADIVKVKCPLKGEKFDEVVQGINIPVIIAGGMRAKSFDEFLGNVSKCILGGAQGISIGRNVFQANNPKLAMKKLKKAVIDTLKEV